MATISDIHSKMKEISGALLNDGWKLKSKSEEKSIFVKKAGDSKKFLTKFKFKPLGPAIDNQVVYNNRNGLDAHVFEKNGLTHFVVELNYVEESVYSFRQFLVEEQEVTAQQLKTLEGWLDKLWSQLRVDVAFTKHFLERVNDPRNGKQITVGELLKLFKDQYMKNGPMISRIRPPAEAVLKDMSTDINSPVVFKWNPARKMIELVAKTIMRKKNFKSPDRTIAV